MRTATTRPPQARGHVGTGDNRVGTPQFGQITIAEDGRVVQLAIKYSF